MTAPSIYNLRVARAIAGPQDKLIQQKLKTQVPRSDVSASRRHLHMVLHPASSKAGLISLSGCRGIRI